MAHLHDMRDMDTHFVIDPISRAITNPDSPKNALMMGDHNSEIYTFELPKVVEGHDMSLCNRVEIHYTNISSDKANKTEDVYPVSDMQLAEDSPDTLVFSWLISGNATKYPGLLSFRIRFGGINASGVYNYKWHTQIFKSVTVSDGFDNTEAVVEEYSDTIAEWEARLDALEEGGSGVEVTAKPGQLIRVKETDENGKPTAWEAVPWGYTEGGMVEILPETTATVDDGSEFLIEKQIDLVVGGHYIVRLNGVDYPSTVVDLGGMGALLNDGADMATGENLLFMISSQDGTTSGQMFDDSTSVTISIHHNAETIHPIPGELLPEGVPYVEKGMVEILPECQPVYDEDDGAFYGIVFQGVVSVGDTCIVNWNGTEYECVAQDLSAMAVGAVLLGDGTNFGATGNGEPFMFVLMEQSGVFGGMIMPLDGTTELTVSVRGNVKTYYKLDKALLPAEAVNNVLVVTIKPEQDENGNYLATHNFIEIISAFESGKVVFLLLWGEQYTYAGYNYDGKLVYFISTRYEYSSANGDITHNKKSIDANGIIQAV